MSFNDFIHKYKFKNKATSNKKIYRVLSSFFLNDVGSNSRNGSFESDMGILNCIHQKELIGLHR